MNDHIPETHVEFPFVDVTIEHPIEQVVKLTRYLHDLNVLWPKIFLIVFDDSKSCVHIVLAFHFVDDFIHCIVIVSFYIMEPDG